MGEYIVRQIQIIGFDTIDKGC